MSPKASAIARSGETGFLLAKFGKQLKSKEARIGKAAAGFSKGKLHSGHFNLSEPSHPFFAFLE